MASQGSHRLPITEKIRSWFRDHFKIPLGVTIAVCVFPVILISLFYILRSSRVAVDWVVIYISSPIRGALGWLSSIYPFAVMEVVCTAAGIFFIYYIIKAILDTSRRREKWKLLGKRLLPLLVVTCYIWGLFSWLWSSGYHATGFAEKNGFSSGGIAREDLVTVTAYFASKANEYSELVERDEDGRYIADRRMMFAESTRIYRNISREFPDLEGRLYAPKPMLFSWLMSITGYSGMYFALTGEAMINTQPPGVYMPATVAHEHAHQLGIFAEDEANFAGILACVTSGSDILIPDNPVFEYAGYMSGLSYLMNALMYSNPLASGPSEEWIEIMNGLSENVLRDRNANSIFWSTRTTSNTGIGFLDNILTAVAETTNDAVNTIYDGYLKSQSQELGIRSYGACVDLLVHYFADTAAEYLIEKAGGE